MQICGHEYKVVIGFVEGKKREEDDFFWGHVDYRTRTIHIHPHAPRSLQEEVLIHEVVHIIMFHTNHRGEHNEGLIAALANALYLMGYGKLLWKLAKPQKEE